MKGVLTKAVNDLKLEQGSLKSELHQLKEAVQGLVNRFDAGDVLRQRTLFYDNYSFECDVTREGTPGFVAMASAGQPPGDELRGVGVTPYAALHDLLTVLERRKSLHAHGGTGPFVRKSKVARA